MNSPQSTTTPFDTPIKRPGRALIACTHCRKRKIKCVPVSSEDPDRSHNSPCERCTKKHLKCEYVPVDGSAPATSPSPPATVPLIHWPNDPSAPTNQLNRAPVYPPSNMVRHEAIPSPYISPNNHNHTGDRLGYGRPPYYQSRDTGRDVGMFAPDSWPRREAPGFYTGEMDIYMNPGAFAYNQGQVSPLFMSGVEPRWSSSVNGHGNPYVAEPHRRENDVSAASPITDD
ncbi:hypothetical protein DFS33DRAFT_1381621 [Desarmillaria ectypa]|nr:hypothetical protein DFS33DRAFT_1381621 [Desarmillaria ectypa]